ncbi:MAG: hypothetical protein EBX47_09985 [Synechococcaceae bacterium WB8_1B_057]|nr:hypothetical protein [Synechococcaceae bacterium WB6_1A_059]NDG79741.1 hypothetical protein [Synechococcaceae bacterium WB8_1B_057]
MALLNFPQNPTQGQTFTIGNKTYTWNGRAWILGATSTATFISLQAETILVTTTTNATSVNTGGALTVRGGASIAGDLYLGGNLVGIAGGGGGIGDINANTATFKTVFLTGGVNATSTTTGDLVIAGGAAIGGDLFLGGILYSGGAPVLTTASFNNTLTDGEDINITDIGGGVLSFANSSTLQTVTARGSTTTFQLTIANTSSSTSTTTGALVIYGGLGVGKRVNAESLRITDTIFDSSIQTVNSVIATVIDEFSFNEFRSAKYLVQIDEGSSSTHRCQMTELLTIVSNTGTVVITEYGSVYTHVDLGNFDALVTSSGADTVVRLYFIAGDAIPKTIKVLRTAMAK